MKYFIAFTLFFLTNCFAPTTTLAVINSKNETFNAANSTANILIIKEKIVLKKVFKKVTEAAFYFIVAITLIVGGIVLFVIAANTPLSGSTLTTLLPQGFVFPLDEFFFGSVFLLSGSLMLLIRLLKNRKKRKQATPSVFPPENSPR